MARRRRAGVALSRFAVAAVAVPVSRRVGEAVHPRGEMRPRSRSFSWRDGALDVVEIRDVHGLPAIALVDARAEFELRCRMIAFSDTDPFEDD